MSGQDDCSVTALAAGTINDADRSVACTGSTFGFHGIGDVFASANTHCIRLAPSGGCNCPDANGNGICDSSTWYQSNGWRNVPQVERFLWDMLDTNNEASQDDTDLAMNGSGGFAELLEGMSCNAGVFGLDGSCNEPERATPGACVPVDSQVPGIPMSGTRDSYNVWDVADLIPDVPGDQAAERSLNCGQGAGD